MNQTLVEAWDGGIRVSGSLRFDTVPECREIGIRLIRDGARRVDLSGVGDADSSALALLMEWQRAAAREGHVLGFHAVPDSIREIAALSEMDRVLNLEKQS